MHVLQIAILIKDDDRLRKGNTQQAIVKNIEQAERGIIGSQVADDKRLLKEGKETILKANARVITKGDRVLFQIRNYESNRSKLSG